LFKYKRLLVFVHLQIISIYTSLSLIIRTNKFTKKWISWLQLSMKPYKNLNALMKDSEVLIRIARGDESALEFLYKKYYRMMTKMVISNSGTEDEARDVYQDALIVFWEKARGGNLVMTSKISTFIYSICLNLWRKELDRKSRLSNEEKEGSEFFEYEKQERIKIIHDCLDELGDTCKKILMYYYFDGMSMNEIADKLGYANTDTAKTKKYKCKKRLDELVKAKYTAGDFMD